MRHNGEWFSNELEPNTQVNAIEDHRTNGQVDERSKVRYSCDEFPPATWVEGGNGIDGTDFSQTRCAAIRCGTGVKAEQNCTFLPPN